MYVFEVTRDVSRAGQGGERQKTVRDTSQIRRTRGVVVISRNSDSDYGEKVKAAKVKGNPIRIPNRNISIIFGPRSPPGAASG